MAEVAERLTGLAIGSPEIEQGGQLVGQRLGADVVLVELRQANTLEAAPDVEGVEVQAAADDADLGRRWPRAGVRATAHADPDSLVAVAARLEIADQVGQEALALG